MGEWVGKDVSGLGFSCSLNADIIMIHRGNNAKRSVNGNEKMKRI